MKQDGLPLLGLSLDADNKWAYLKTHGDPGWEEDPGYLDVLSSTMIEFFGRFELAPTVFVVGRDAADPSNHAALRALVGAGFELGNHSYSHEPWLGRAGREEAEREVARAEEAIRAATGVVPRGFRGPGFALSRTLLEILAERGYRYDASLLPTFIGPLARLYYFRRSQGLDPEARRRRASLFGSVRDAFMPDVPFRWRLRDGQSLLEIPVTTMPLVRVPIHQSYLLWLARKSAALARSYLRTAIALCRWTRTRPAFLLHPLDLLGRDRVRGLDFFPAMDMTTAEKLDFLERVLAVLSIRFRPVPMSEFAAAAERKRLRMLDPPAA